MPLKFCICPGCSACPPGKRSHTFDRDTSPGHNRCAPCQAATERNREATRPSAAARGYGADHRKRAAAVLDGATECCYCGKPPQPDDPFVACHIYAQSRGGPKDGPLAAGHRSCNAIAAGKLNRGKRRR